MSRSFFSAKIPLDPTKSPIFYGWIILIVGMVGVLISIPGHSSGLSPFIDEILASLELSRMQFSMAYGLATLTSAFMLPLGGRIYDVYGIRPVSITLLALFGVVFILNSILFPWIGDNVNSASTRLLLLYIMVVMIRFIGQGMLPLMMRTMVVRWFYSKRSFTSAILNTSTSIGNGAAPLLIGSIIAFSGDWTRVWLLFGVGFIVLAVPMAWIFFRDNPEDFGLQMDGVATSGANSAIGRSIPSQRQWVAKDVIRTFPFWVIVIGLLAFNVSNTGMVLHLDSVGRSMGIEDSIRSLLVPMACVSVVVNFVASYFLKRFTILSAYRVQMVLQVISAVSFSLLDTTFGWYGYIFAHGAAWGFYGILNAVLWPHFYGKKNLGAIVGWVSSILVVASSLGPVIYSGCFDWLGSYRPAASVLGGLSIIAFCLLSLKVVKNGLNESRCLKS